MIDKVRIADKLRQFDDHWSPRIVGAVDDYEVKLVKIEGDFVWHSHDDEDEMFLVVDGAFRMDFRDRQVAVGRGEFIVVPRGVEHKPYAETECHILLFERRGVVNTGTAERGELTVEQPERI